MLAREESLAAILGEVQPLVQEHWEESHGYRKAPLNPNWRGMLFYAERGLFRVVTLRSNQGELVGYLTFSLTVSSQTSEACGNLETFFVKKGWRFGRGAVMLMEAAERLFLSLGLTSVYSSNPLTASPALNKLMTKFGYAPVSTVYHKHLSPERNQGQEEVKDG
jgi:hypothetical protein